MHVSEIKIKITDNEIAEIFSSFSEANKTKVMAANMNRILTTLIIF